MKKALKGIFWTAVVVGLLVLADRFGNRDYQKHLDDLDARHAAYQADLAAHPQDPDPRRR